MAKQQSFMDKAIKGMKKEEKGVYVKVIKAYRTAKGSIRFRKKMVKLKDISEIEKIEL